MGSQKASKQNPFEHGCRVCGADVTLVRGLCDVHYRRFLARIKSLAADEGTDAAEMFEADCLANGWVTAKSKGGRQKDVDPFDVIAAKIVAECKSTYAKRKNGGTHSA